MKVVQLLKFCARGGCRLFQRHWRQSLFNIWFRNWLLLYRNTNSSLEILWTTYHRVDELNSTAIHFPIFVPQNSWGNCLFLIFMLLIFLSHKLTTGNTPTNEPQFFLQVIFQLPWLAFTFWILDDDLFFFLYHKSLLRSEYIFQRCNCQSSMPINDK